MPQSEESTEPYIFGRIVNAPSTEKKVQRVKTPMERLNEILWGY